jgi:hypothetical protein
MPRPLSVLLAVVLVGPLLTPVLVDAAAAGAPQATVVLTLAQEPAARAGLHALAGRPGRHDLAHLAPAVQHRAAVLAWARREGLQVLRSDAWTVSVRGPRPALAGASAVLRHDVSSVIGLDERRVHLPHATRDGLDNPQDSAAMRAAYDVPSDWRGSGLTVGILNLAGWERSDLTTFAQHEGIALSPGQLTEVPVGLNPTELDGYGSEFEVALDSEAVLAAAPAANQRLYFARNTEAGVVDAISAMASDAEAGRIQVATTSWGICERQFQEGSPGLQAAYATAVDRLVAAGATLFAASGDAGAFDCSTGDQPDNQAEVDFPASYVNTVGVGGTTLTQGQSEIAWHDSGFGPFLGYGTGGGESLDQPLPSYQAGLVPGAAHRLVPDVASDADPQSGLGVYVRSAGGWTQAGGTSLAAPTWAGMLASALSSAGRTTGAGNVLPALYANASGGGLVDITEGHNALWSATAGFDRTTGLGVPRWSALGPAVLGAPAGAPSDGTPTAGTSRPPPAADPVFRATPAWTRSTTVPVTVSGQAGYSGFSVGETVEGCAQLQETAPTTVTLDPAPYQGEHLLTLTALDSSLTCHVLTASVGYDTVAPVATVGAALLTTADTRVRIGMGGSDAASGVSSWHLVVRPLGGQPVLTTDTTSTQVITKLTAGRTYSIEASARDRAGNVGAPAMTRVTLPLDDAAFARTGSWGREPRAGDYQGTHLRSGTAGSTARYVLNGRDVTLWLLRSGAGGYADVVVDGRRTQRLDLYAAQTSLLRVRVGAWGFAGRHTVQVNVVGAHRPGSRGSNVLLDALVVTP